MNVRDGLPFQPVDATHWLNRSAGVSKYSVFLGRSSSMKNPARANRAEFDSDTDCWKNIAVELNAIVGV